MYRVLLVDDCLPDLTGIINNIDWASLKCEIVGTASNGEIGIKKARELKPDIIITDVSMPKLNGLEMTREIRAEMPDISFIFISCFDEFKYIKSAMDQNVSAYILKPIKLTELYSTIQKVIASIDQKRKYEKLETSFKNISEAQVENLLSDLLLSEDFDKEYANLLNIPYTECFRPVLLTQADNSEILPTDFYKKITELKEICMKHAPGEKNYFLKFGVTSLVILLHEDSMSEMSFQEYVQTLTQHTDSYGNIFISFSVEPIVLSDISKAFNTMLSSSHSKGSVPDMRSLYQSLSSILSSGNYNDISEFVDLYFDSKVQENLNYSKTVSVQIINTLNLILNEYNNSFSDIFDDEFIVWNKLFNYKSIINIKQWITNLITAVMEFLSSETEQLDKYDIITSKIKTFINEHFPSPTILEDVANAVNLSVNHANNIFKTTTGQTMFSYAVNMRINRAKQLMADPTKSISTISREVGYASSSYFTTAFKKNVGMSPMQYRSHQTGNSEQGEDE